MTNQGAGFGAGTYRLINYSRNLVDNGLTVGTAPSGFSYSIDTATEGEVNLVVTDDSGDFSGLLLPERLSFSNVEAGQSGVPKPLLLTGTGADPLKVAQVNLVGTNAGAFQLTEDTCTGQSLNQNQDCDLAEIPRPILRIDHRRPGFRCSAGRCDDERHRQRDAHGPSRQSIPRRWCRSPVVRERQVWRPAAPRALQILRWQGSAHRVR